MLLPSPYPKLHPPREPHLQLWPSLSIPQCPFSFWWRSGETKLVDYPVRCWGTIERMSKLCCILSIWQYRQPSSTSNLVDLRRESCTVLAVTLCPFWCPLDICFWPNTRHTRTVLSVKHYSRTVAHDKLSRISKS